MIHAIGIDLIKCVRFTDWYKRNDKQLLRIFSTAEIDYCRQHPSVSTERFAARFAAKEAFFKAWSSYDAAFNTPFITACRFIQVVKNNNGAPQLHIDHSALGISPLFTGIRPLLSITHTGEMALALVIIVAKTEKISPS